MLKLLFLVLLATIAVKLVGWEGVEAGADLLQAGAEHAYEVVDRQSAQVRARAEVRHAAWLKERERQ